MAHEAASLPSPESDAAFPDADNDNGWQTAARLQERERRKNANPPTNSEKKYICVHPIPFEKPNNCAELVFDRKCEWNKHMDKHDRPFRCEHPECSKLQGFTYPGGLARHEKEVHGKHGGPTAQLVCPFSNCKRSRGKKFTRKENLEEHIKRCHTIDGEEEETETQDADAILEAPQNETVATLLTSSDSQSTPNEENTKPIMAAAALAPVTNASFEPNNIDPAIAAAQDAAGLATIAVDTVTTSGRKRKSGSNFIFKMGNGRAKRRKTDTAPENEITPEGTNANVFEELERLRAENAKLLLELQSRDARIATLETARNGLEQSASA